MFILIVFLLSFSCISYGAAVHEYPIVIVIPSRNNVDVCKKNLTSVFAQTYKNYRVIYIDDASDDGTYEAVCSYITQQQGWHRVLMVRNEQRQGSLYNQFRAIHTCKNNEIIVILDGDDALMPNALSVINAAYQDDQVWMTYGQYREDPTGKAGHCKNIPYVVKINQAYRYYDWVTSHPRTFYAGLFKQIPLGYLLYEDGFQPSAIDLATMFSMLELSNGRFHFIDEVLYLYNCANPNNIFKKNLLTQLTMNYSTRGRKPLQALSFDPRTINQSSAHVTVGMIVLSDNNPKQLAALLDQLDATRVACDEVRVVYMAKDYDTCLAYLDVFERHPFVRMQPVAASDGLKASLLALCQMKRYSHIVLMLDTTPIEHIHDVKQCVNLLEKTHACGFYFNVASQDKVRTVPSTLCNTMPPLVPLEQDVYAWQFKHAAGKWQLPYTCDGALYRAQDLQEAIALCLFNTGADLCCALQFLKAPGHEDVGLCFML